MILILVLILIAIGIIWTSQMIFPVLPSYFYQTIGLLFAGTVGINYFLVDVKKNRPDYFVPLYIATQFVKILAYGSYMLFVVWDQSVEAANHVLIFMITYFLFTAAEIIFLYRKVTR